MLSNFKTLLDTLNVPVAYHHFNEKTSLPYIVFYENGSDNFFADNKVYQKCMSIDVELYTNIKDTTLESRLETLLDNNEIPYEKITETYINDEKMYEIVYQIFMYD